MKTVTFCGHGDLDGLDIEFIEQGIKDEAEKLIKKGAREFLLGGYGDFDILCARVVKGLKEKYPYIESVIVVPYIDKSFDKELYDYSEFPPIENTPKKYAIVKRNEYMIDKSDAVISLVNHDWGGAANTLKYADKKNKRIIQIICI